MFSIVIERTPGHFSNSFHIDAGAALGDGLALSTGRTMFGIPGGRADLFILQFELEVTTKDIKNERIQR